MKWHSPKEQFIPNRSRIIHRKFLFWPLCLHEETRWLEKANIEYEWYDGYGAFISPGWIIKRFADEVADDFDRVLPPR
jgi:hypothetical protein